MANTRHALGVLFVHGIGEQPRGDTLLSFGEPMIRCLQQWVNGRGIGSADVIESKLSATQLEPGEPAHAVLEMSLGNRPPHTWLLTESWWAEEFRRPPFMKLAGWLLTIGPWALISHASRWLRDAPGLQQPYQLAKVVLAVPLSMLMQVLVAALAVLAWLPVPVLRRRIAGFLLTVTGTLGDSYVLLENPAQRAAAISTLHANVEWLADRCDQVVVVAHSQGAAIARLMLKRPHPRVSLLVTFGSGVAKLTELDSLSMARPALAVRTMLAVSLGAMLLLPRALTLVVTDDARSVIWTMFLFMPLVVVMTAVIVVLRRIASWSERAASLSLAPLPWIDYWATSDPVPNGPLAPQGTVENLRQIKLTNRISWLTDHTTYWQNRDEFILPLLREMDARAGTGAFAGQAPPPVRIPERRTRVKALVAARVVTWLAPLIPLIALREPLVVFGRDVVLPSLAVRPVTKPISELLTGLASIAGAAIGPLLPLDSASLEAVGHWSVSALILLVLIAAWYRFCVLPVWESWDTQCFNWVCRPKEIPEGRLDRALRPMFLAVVAIIPLALSLRAVFQPDAGLLLEEGLNTVIVVPVVVIALVMLVGFTAGVGSLIVAGLHALGWVHARGKEPDASVAKEEDGSHEASVGVDGGPDRTARLRDGARR